MEDRCMYWLRRNFMTFILLMLSFTASARMVQDSIESNEAMERVMKSINSLEQKQATMKKDYSALHNSLSNRDSVLKSTLVYLDDKMGVLQDSIDALSREFSSSVMIMDQKSENIEDRLRGVTAMSYIGIGFLLFIAAVSIVFLKRSRESAQRNDPVNYDEIQEKFEEILRHYQGGLESSAIQVKDSLKSLNQIIDKENSALAQTGDNLSEIAYALRSDVSKLVSDLDGQLSTLIQFNSDIAAMKDKIVEKSPEKQSNDKSIAATFIKPEKVAYDAAVNTWININDHLYSLGKDRKRIPHVYALLAGQEVDSKDLQKDLAQLSEERREGVNSIISDINRFKEVQLPVIEAWISAENQRISTIKDAVRYPLNQSFDNRLDEELTGDSVSDGTPIVMVASLGYLFPGSLNGSYRVKARVLV